MKSFLKVAAVGFSVVGIAYIIHSSPVPCSALPALEQHAQTEQALVRYQQLVSACAAQ